MANVAKSQILNSLKKKTKGAWNKARTTEAKAKGARLPDGIVKGVAQLTSYKMDLDKKKNPYFMISGVVVSPTECVGMRATVSHFISETQTKTIEDKLAGLSSDVQLLGGVTDGTDIDDLPKILDELVAAKPFFYFNTWKPKDGDTMVFIQGVAETPEGMDDEPQPEGDGGDEPPADEPEAEPAEEPEPEGDELDGLNRDELKKLVASEKVEADGKPFVVYRTTEDEQIREAIRNHRGNAEPEPEAEPEEPEAPAEDWTPEVKEVYLYKTSPKVAPEEVEVTKVDKKKKTVDLKRVKDKKAFPGVPWTKLQGES